VRILKLVVVHVAATARQKFAGSVAEEVREAAKVENLDVNAPTATDVKEANASVSRKRIGKKLTRTVQHSRIGD